MIALVVIGNGRTEYLRPVVNAAIEHLPGFDAYLMVDDSGDPQVRRQLDRWYPGWIIEHHAENRGMAAAVQSGFDLALDVGARHVFWLEEDMVLTDQPPIDEAITVLEQSPGLAQMCFRRAPVYGNQYEAAAGCQLSAIIAQAGRVFEWPTYTEHDFLFSLNPCLIPRRVLEAGWDADNEAGMTAKLREQGFMFGSWGHASDGQVWARHIGERRGPRWRL